MNGKRKNRSSLGRSPRGRGIERVPSIDGIYHNANFMHAITSQIGNVVKVYTHTGTVYEGILKTFSSQFEVVLELAHKIDSACPTTVTVNTVIEKIIFKPHDVIFIEVLDSETDYATRDTFLTDTAISKFNGQVSEKELEPWDGSTLDDECELESNGSLNGWDVNDMFRKNEQMYGITSNFDNALSGYTTQLQKQNSKDYKEAEAKAAKIASEIENQPNYKAKVDVENGDEEEKFASVVRPGSEGSVSSDSTNKYVCPPKRKPQAQPAAQQQPSPPPPPPKPLRNIHSKIQEHKPSSSMQYYHTSSVSSSGASDSHPGVRERVNGLAEPKPQRTITNHRPVGRNYPSSDTGRNSNGYIVNASSSAVEYNQTPSQINVASSSSNSPGVTSPEVNVPPMSRKPSPGVIPSHGETSDPRQLPSVSHMPRKTSPVVMPSQPEVTPSHMQRKPPPQTVMAAQPEPMQRKIPSGVLSSQSEPNVSHIQRKLSPAIISSPSDAMAPPMHRKPSAGMVSSPTETVPPHIQRKISPGVISSSPEVPHLQRKLSSSYISSQEMSAASMQRKPTHNPPLIHPLTGEQLRTKPSRGREEHFNELKKFSADFHLAEAPPTESPKVQNVPAQHEEDNRLSGDPSVNSDTSNAPRPSSSPSAPTESDKSTPTYIKSKLNPNAKEFVYNPNAKPFTPRASTTPTQSRPHTPQTPSYGVPAVPVHSLPATAMVVPTYVVTTAQPHYAQPAPNQPSRYRKVHMGMPPRPDMASQMQVAAATGQPLLAPGPLPAQFTVPYTQPHLANQPYQQMVRMVAPQGGGMVPLVPATLNYPPDPNQPHAQHIQYMGQGAMAVPHHPHHNPYLHGNPAVSPQPPANNSQLGPINSNGVAPSPTNGANASNGSNHQQPYPSLHHTPHPHLAPFSFTVV